MYIFLQERTWGSLDPVGKGGMLQVKEIKLAQA